MVKVSRRRTMLEVLCSWGEGIARKTGREKGRCRLEVEKIRLEVCDLDSHPYMFDNTTTNHKAKV